MMASNWTQHLGLMSFSFALHLIGFILVTLCTENCTSYWEILVFTVAYFFLCVVFLCLYFHMCVSVRSCMEVKGQSRELVFAFLEMTAHLAGWNRAVSSPDSAIGELELQV